MGITIINNKLSKVNVKVNNDKLPSGGQHSLDLLISSEFLVVEKAYINRANDTYHARWVNLLSTEQATTSQFIFRNSCTRSLNAMISVGQTNVLRK